jgi:hypothetical protein
MKILFEEFPDVMDNKGVTRDDNVKWVTLYAHQEIKSIWNQGNASFD